MGYMQIVNSFVRVKTKERMAMKSISPNYITTIYIQAQLIMYGYVELTLENGEDQKKVIQNRKVD